MNQVFPITVPSLNANDESVRLVDWLVEHRACVEIGEALCEIETSKAAAVLEAEHEGLLYQTCAAPSTVGVGQRIGLIGPDREAIELFLSNETAAHDRSKVEDALRPPLRATARAQALAAQHGLALEQVAITGVEGTIKEADVQRYLTAQKQAPEFPAEARDQTELPATIRDCVTYEGILSRHEQFVAQNLERSLQSLLLATIDAELDLTTVKQRIQRARKDGTMLSLLHILMCALGRALPFYPRLISFRHNGHVYRYRQLDLAFVVRTREGRLFTPVVRGVDKLDAVQTAQACNRMAMRVTRDRLEPNDLEGSCFTVSHVPSRTATRLDALPNRFQSAILAIAGERSMLSLRDGQIAQVPLVTVTLSYDHALCDAMYAAEFLQALIENVDSVLS